MRTILAELIRLNIAVKNVVPLTQTQDGHIFLSGSLDGVRIDVEMGAYAIFREAANQQAKYIRGAWLLEEELKKIMC